MSPGTPFRHARDNPMEPSPLRRGRRGLRRREIRLDPHEGHRGSGGVLQVGRHDGQRKGVGRQARREGPAGIEEGDRARLRPEVRRVNHEDPVWAEPADGRREGLGHGPREEHTHAAPVGRIDRSGREHPQPVRPPKLVADPDDGDAARPSEPVPQASFERLRRDSRHVTTTSLSVPAPANSGVR